LREREKPINPAVSERENRRPVSDSERSQVSERERNR